MSLRVSSGRVLGLGFLTHCRRMASQVMLIQVSLDLIWKMVSHAGGLGLGFRVLSGRIRKLARSYSSWPPTRVIYRASLIKVLLTPD